MLGVEVQAGNEHTGSHSLPGLLHVLDGLPENRSPRIVRGDCGFDSDTLMRPLEERQQGYLFKLNDPDTGYEYAVPVTNADCENAFDELKNQWGWGGFTTHDLHRCQLSARAVALIYTQRVREPLRGNWWSLFVRPANPEARREAITSRPWLSQRCPEASLPEWPLFTRSPLAG